MDASSHAHIYEDLRTALLFWFRKHKRPLPWRNSYTPYEIWISEIMLQQTQVKTVLPYYHRWMERFPDVRSVAEAPEDELLKLWEGLGYYSRARNIHKAARHIVSRHGGIFPHEARDIQALPGLGPYTLGAVMSLAYNEPYPIVDGNVERVFARIFNLKGPVKSKECRRFIWETAGELVPMESPRDFNQALMELGAMVCVPRNPLCGTCPVAALCESLRCGVVAARPVSSPRKIIHPLGVAIGLLVRDDKVFIQKRPPHGLMPHLWEFPGGKIQESESPEAALHRELHEELGVSVRHLDKIAVIRHSYTTFKVSLHAFFCELEDPRQEPSIRSAVEGRWASREELDHHAFPAANRKLIQRL